MIRLRLARPDDIPTLLAWDSEPHVIAASGDDEPWDWAEEIARQGCWQWLYVAEVGGRPIGMVQIIDPALEETHYWGDVPVGLRAIDIWIGPPDALGKGYGTQMIRQAFDICFAAPDVTAILIDPLKSNTDAIRFYQRLGFEFVEHRCFGSDDCAVHRLSRETWQNRHRDPGLDPGAAIQRLGG